MFHVAALLASDVSHHSKCFEIDFGSHNRGSETQDDATLQTLQRVGQDQEVAIAGRPVRRSIAIRMFVNDIVSDSSVDGRGHGQSMGCGENAQMPMREAALE